MPTGRTSNKDIPTFGEIQIKGKDIVSNGTAGSAQTIEFAIGSDNTSFDSQEISDFYIDSVVLKQEALKYDLNFVSNETAQNMPSKQTITAGVQGQVNQENQLELDINFQDGKKSFQDEHWKQIALLFDKL
ncbi:hypothetical protein BKN14_01385 [Candidatus Gracilibacteria bacterium HOT-871]|nr:hypothetical protein BKN14_01385 [Candidatus Gracilibacteria bacterium HOT-871]